MIHDLFTHLHFSMASFRPMRVAEMTTPRPSILLSALLLSLTLLGVLPLWSGSSFAAASSLNAVSCFADTAGLPVELGAIVYQKNPERPFQLFIIGNSHRSSVSGENGINTVLAQVQTYRIAEWLIRQQQIELLLPEGFFGRKERTGRFDATLRFDGPTLEKTLADTSTFINADLLLHRNYGVGLQQVEDRDLYRNAREYIYSALKNGASLDASFAPELEYLQERRSAAMLQKVPAVISAAYRQGHIAQPRAILTIGMAHLDEIIRFLESGRIEIPAPPIGARGFQPYSEMLELLAQQVGVTVIVPQGILVDRKMMSMANIESQAGTKTPGIFHPGEI